MYKFGDGVKVVRGFRYGGVSVAEGEIGTVIREYNSSCGGRAIVDVAFSGGAVIAYFEAWRCPDVRPLTEHEFDQGGLKRMPDGTLESVDIPGPEAEREPIPYTATGTGGPPRPKLDFKVAVGRLGTYVVLREGGAEKRDVCISRYGFFGGKRSRAKLAKLIANAKSELLADYELSVRESGLV